MMKKKKYEKGIALYGGTFDPVHNGHIRIASVIKQLPFIEDVWLHVAGNPRYKEPMFNFSERTMFADEFENVMRIYESYDFTYQVLRKLRKIYGKETPIYFFVGKEWNLNTFKNADYVKKNCIPIPIPKIEISVRSTQIREMIKRKESLEGLVPDNIWISIKENYYV